MSRKSEMDELFDIAFDIVTIIVEGHRTLKRTPLPKRSEKSAYRRAQRFCYGVVEKNIRDMHNCLYDNGTTLLYSSHDAFPLTKKNEFRVEHSLPIVEMAAKWYESDSIDAEMVIKYGVFNPIVKLTVEEDKRLYKAKADDPRVNPYSWIKKRKPRKSCYSLAHTNPDYECPFRRNYDVWHELYSIGTDGNIQFINDIGNFSYEKHLEFIETSRLGKLYNDLLLAFA